MIYEIIIFIFFYSARSYLFHLYIKFSIVRELCGHIETPAAFISYPERYWLMGKIFGFLSFITLAFLIERRPFWVQLLLICLIVLLYFSLNWIVKLNARYSAVSYYRRYIKKLVEDDIALCDDKLPCSKLSCSELLNLSDADFYEHARDRVVKMKDLNDLMMGERKTKWAEVL